MTFFGKISIGVGLFHVLCDHVLTLPIKRLKKKWQGGLEKTHEVIVADGGPFDPLLNALFTT